MKTFQLTTGIRKIRNAAAAKLAVAVLYATFKSFVASIESSNVSMPVLAAVSPKRESGPCIKAGSSPR